MRGLSIKMKICQNMTLTFCYKPFTCNKQIKLKYNTQIYNHIQPSNNIQPHSNTQPYNNIQIYNHGLKVWQALRARNAALLHTSDNSTVYIVDVVRPFKIHFRFRFHRVMVSWKISIYIYIQRRDRKCFMFLHHTC